MRIEHNYDGTRDEAYQQIGTLLASLQEQHGDRISNPSTSWNSARDQMTFSFGVYGFTLRGTVQIQDGKIVFDGRVPWAAKLFQGRAETLIKEKLEEIL